MLRKRDSKEITFYGVGVGLILLGSACLAISIVQWLFNYYGEFVFYWPVAKGFGGLLLVALGYIILQLELLRTSK